MSEGRGAITVKTGSYQEKPPGWFNDPRLQQKLVRPISYEGKEKPYRSVRPVRKSFLKYRIVSRSPYEGHHLRSPPTTSRSELTKLLENLQSIAFVQYNEVRTHKSRPSATERVAGENTSAAVTIVEGEQPQPKLSAAKSRTANLPDAIATSGKPQDVGREDLAQSAKLVHDLILGKDVQVNGPVPSTSPRISTWTRLQPPAPETTEPFVPPQSVRRVPLFEPSVHQSEEQMSQNAPGKEEIDLGMSSEEIEEVYFRSLDKIQHLKSTASRTILKLHRLKPGIDPDGLVDPDLPSLDLDNIEDQRSRSKLEDPPLPLADLPADQVPVSERKKTKLPLVEPIPDWVPQLDRESAERQKYHILGFDVRAKYLAHRLSGSLLRPPVEILVRDPQVPQAWELLGKTLTLHRDNRVYAHTRVVPQLVRSFRPGQIVMQSRSDRPEDESIIENLIITAPARTIMAELRPIRHRINQNTTIVLVQDGLGIPEALNLQFFPDPATRPRYIEGHLAALLYSLKEDPFAIKEMAMGSLYLSTRMKDPDVLVRKFPDQQLYGPTKLLQSLSTVKELDMVPCVRAMFLFHKLPMVMAQSIVEPLSVLVDGRYSEIPRGYPNNRLIERMLMEMCAIVTSLPEFAAVPEAQHYFDYDRGSIRNRCLAILTKRAKTSDTSQMWRLIKDGKVTDIMYLNGYFSSRAAELGMSCPANDAVINLVKAKHETKVRELKTDIEFAGWSRTMAR